METAKHEIEGLDERKISTPHGNRNYTRDVCDWCHVIGWVPRAMLAKRRFGIRFACEPCVETGKAPFGPGTKTWKMFKGAPGITKKDPRFQR